MYAQLTRCFSAVAELVIFTVSRMLMFLLVMMMMMMMMMMSC